VAPDAEPQPEQPYVEQADDAESPLRSLAPAPVYAPPPPPPPAPPAPPLPTLEGRTHNTLFPTGEMLRDGDAQVRVHEFVYVQAAVALSDHFELNVSTPIFPGFVSVGARVGLTSPDSPFKLVGSGALYVPLVDDADVGVVSGSLTVAYSTPRFNLHATAGIAVPTDAEDDSALGVVNVGGAIMIGRKVAVFAELTEITVGEPGDHDALGLTGVGLKFMGQSTDLDVGLFAPRELDNDEWSEDELVALPMVSLTSRF
jgi:hypothetical protein